MTTSPPLLLTGSNFPIIRARRRASVVIAALALAILAAALAATLYFVQSGNERPAFSSPIRSGLSASIFAKVPVSETDKNVVVAVEETSSDARVLEQLSADQARARNAAIRAAANVGPAAQPLKV